jgi:hypothetical protein
VKREFPSLERTTRVVVGSVGFGIGDVEEVNVDVAVAAAAVAAVVAVDVVADIVAGLIVLDGFKEEGIGDNKAVIVDDIGGDTIGGDTAVDDAAAAADDATNGVVVVGLDIVEE